jgi:hypothetical protein
VQYIGALTGIHDEPHVVPGIGYADEDVGGDEQLADCAEILVENR